MEADKGVIVEAEKPRPKQTDFFPRLPSNSEQLEFPCFLKCFQPTDTLCPVGRTKYPIRRPKKAPPTGSVCTTNCPSHEEDSLRVLAMHRLAMPTRIVPRLVDINSYMYVVSIYSALWLFGSNFEI